MTLRWRLKYLAHRTGLVASPTLAFRDVPFGWRRRYLAAEVFAALAENRAPCDCCPPPGG
ncbi:hypothetical protein [Actinacidiphila sp. ITFR-21]|uniref:hypothetical protein n=1 Tax=Actinacidiphila sp. ITFR-21 TaxID=3075199 RepID=UPI00288BCD42|nr:hypothetical protein [Streptomyces sp. ITFR-21]WNI20297.1 hypothetical protein RLT57_33050 [Streptomyces sp. ITFR-21]